MKSSFVKTLKICSSYILLPILWVPYWLNGQNVTYQTLYNNTTFEAKAINKSLPVGSVEGLASAAQGMASYTIPIQLPAGTNNVVPALSITYQSQISDGPLGMGWNLIGLSAITRNIKSLYHDGVVSAASISAQDRFALDGSRLIATGTNPVYGAPNTTYSKESEDFSKITSYGTSGTGPTHFKVETKEGVEMEYGNTTDSKLMAKNNTDVLLWKINKILYKDGNYIEYVYETINNEIRIKEIKYTGNATVTPVLLPYNTITFEYKLRDANQVYKNTTYEADREIGLNSLLTKISITADGQTFKSYTFNYAHNNVNVFLNEVIETGSDGTSSLNSTIFQYGDQPTQITPIGAGFSNSNGNDLISGDFNGDGFTDICTANKIIINSKAYHSSISVYTKDQNGNGFTYRYNKSLPFNGEIQEGSSSYNVLGSDFNGDGRDDLAYLLTDKYQCNQSYISGETFFKELRIYLNNTDATNATELVITLPSSYTYDHDGTFAIDRFFTTGDFNGDNIQDVFIVLRKRLFCYGINPNIPHSKGFIWYGNSGLTTFSEVSISGTSNFKFNDNSNWSTKILNSIDFEGDGKSEIMITKGSYSEIFSVNNTSISSLHLAGFPTQYHHIFIGDFNGDRKSDLLTRSSLSDNGAAWNVALSTGKAWIEKPFTWFNSLPDISENSSKDKVLISDFNGDGKSDIIHHFDFMTASKINTYYSTGNTFNNVTYDYSSKQVPIKVIGDFNADGRSDFATKSSYTGNASFVQLNPNGQELLLQRVKNGVGHISKFSYTKMSEPGGHYSKSTNVSYPFLAASLPMYLVTRIDKDDLVETTYSYADAIIHRRGRGILGFRRVTESGPISASARSSKGTRAYTGPTRYNHKQHSYFNLNSNFALLVLDSVVNVKGVERLGKKTITNEIVQQNTGTLERIFWHKTPKVINENILEKNQSEAENTAYDTDGNVTDSKMIYYTKSGTTLTEVERVVTVSQFGMFGSFRKNVTTQLTNTTTRAGQNAYSSVIQYSYTNKGQLQTKVDFSNQTKPTTTTYTYDNLGNIYTVTLSSPTLTSRSSTNLYDAKGRFIVTSTNALNQTSTATYDNRWAKPLTSTGVDGIKSMFEYDVFGRIIKTYYRKDLTDQFNTSISYLWETTGSSYYTLLSHPGKPDVKTFFDALGRKIKQETEGFQGHWIRETYLYDGNGNMVSHNGPHRPSASESSGLITSTSFDDYGRVQSVSNSLRTIVYSYDYTGGRQKVTQTLDLPVGQTDQVTSQTKDVTGKIISSTDDAGTLDFTYYSHGNVRNIKRGTLTLSSMLYDVYARQTNLTDINSGTTTYEYNAFGELIKENQPSGNNLTYTYDALGKIVTRSGTEGTTSYLYCTSGVKINKLDKVTSFSTGYEESFSYDNVYAKLTSKTEKINGTTFVTSFTYNKYDDLLTTTYPSGIIVSNEYDANGYLTLVKNGSTTLFTNQAMTSYNNYKTYQYGNGLITDVTYQFTIPTRFYSRNSNATIKRQDLNLNWNYATGNLNSRNDAIVDITETFTYDIMNRLTSTKVGSNAAFTMNYSTDGNMTVKSDAADAGGLEYLHSKINAVTKVQNSISIPYDQQEITYAVYQRATKITEGTKSLELAYSYDYKRRLATFKTNTTTDETRCYIGNYEKQSIGSTNRDIHYVSNGERLIAIIVKESSTTTNYYVHTDHLGSILAITKSDMTYETRQNYDAWGRKRNVDNWTYTGVQSVPTWLYRGYTGHEEYPQFNLINMNARLYDPLTGRMLSPDIAVTMPYSSQGYNRYSYANNNPLKYIDPDGNEPITLTMLLIGTIKAAAMGAAMGVAMNGISNMIQDKNFFSGWSKAAAIGALTGAVSAGIGWVAGNIAGATKVQIALAQGLMHGWSGAVFTMLQGGNPGTGFLSGFSSSVSASSVQSLGGGKIATLIGGALSGGVGAAVVGGDFMQGATFGLISTSLNHLAEHASKGVVAIRKKIAEIAKSYIGSKKWNYDVSKDNFKENSNKCNKFVYDVVAEAGANPGTPNGNTLGQIFGQDGTSPPTAGQWADPNFEIPGWEIVNTPKPGDVVAVSIDYSDATGHVAIIGGIGRAYGFSVGTSGTYNAISKTKFGIVNVDRFTHGGQYVYRRYVGN